MDKIICEECESFFDGFLDYVKHTHTKQVKRFSIEIHAYGEKLELSIPEFVDIVRTVERHFDEEHLLTELDVDKLSNFFEKIPKIDY